MGKLYPDMNMSTSGDVLKYANTVTNGAMGVLGIFAFWILIFLVLKWQLYKTSEASSIAFILSLVMGSFLWAMKVIQGRVIVIILLGTIACTIWMVLDSQ